MMNTADEHDRIEAEIDRKGLSSDPFAAAVRATRMPMIITDPHREDNPIVFANNAFSRRTGYARDEIIGRNCRFLQGPDTDRSDVAKVREAIARREPIEIELLNYKKNGETFWNRLLMSPVFDNDGVLTYFFASQFDISLERLAEQHLRGLNETLELRVAQTIADRSKVEEQLHQSQKMEAIGQLTGGVAHDFNNLLTVIRGSLDLLRRPNLSVEKQQRYLEMIAETTARATKLTGQLLAFARRQTLKPEVLDVVQNVTAISHMLIRLVGARVRLNVIAPDKPVYVNVDQSQLDAALVNIVVNARDAMSGNGCLTIVITQMAEIPAVRGHSSVPGEYVAVAITDTGTGIATEVIDRIFEPFFTTKVAGEGTGLGLSQVFGFAKQSAGEVIVESQLGLGTTFTLYFPRVEPPATLTDKAASDLALPEAPGMCILLVEDNPDVGEFTLQALSELGNITMLASKAEHALAELEKDAGRFNVVFSDVVMPGMSGIELAREVRRLYPGLPVVLTSGYSHVLSQNANHDFELVHKPYSMKELSRVLGNVARRP